MAWPVFKKMMRLKNVIQQALSKRHGLDTVYAYEGPPELLGQGVINLKEISIDPARNGFRLPTEAQWEYACAGGVPVRVRAQYYWSALPFFSWMRENSGLRPHVGGTRQPNRIGLYDMLGNVSEWCNDAMESLEKDKRDDKLYYNNCPLQDPAGPVLSIQAGHVSLVGRGGNSGGQLRYVRPADRNGGRPSERGGGGGLRVVLPAPAGSSPPLNKRVVSPR